MITYVNVSLDSRYQDILNKNFIFICHNVLVNVFASLHISKHNVFIVLFTYVTLHFKLLYFSVSRAKI